MEYAALVDVYERLEATSSNLEKTAILAEALADADEAQLPILVKLLRGTPFAAWEAEELGISSRLTTEAIATATGVDEDAIEATWRDTGDLGDAAAEAVANRKQRTLVTTRLDVRTVHDTLQELATYEGEGSQERRIEAVAGLLNDADASEARYVVRTVLGHLRVGIGDGTVRDAIADALGFLNHQASLMAFNGGVLGVVPFRDRWVGNTQTRDSRESIDAMREIASGITIFPTVRESEQYKKAVRRRMLPSSLGFTDLEYPFERIIAAIGGEGAVTHE